MAATRKVWTQKGAEQKELERLFLDNKINYNSSIEKVQSLNPLFKDFNENIFSAHFRKTRAALGLSAVIPSVPSIEEFEKHARSSAIPELGIVNASRPMPQSSSPTDDFSEGSSNIEFQGAPFSTWMYTDHHKKTDFVCVVMPVFSGVKEMDFDLSEDGSSVVVTYLWPGEHFKATELFKESIEKKEISAEHPKIHSFVTNLINSGITENSQPKGTMKVSLPCKVKREIGSWQKKAFKVNETKLIMLEFTAYQKALMVKDADKSLKFD